MNVRYKGEVRRVLLTFSCSHRFTSSNSIITKTCELFQSLLRRLSHLLFWIDDILGDQFINIRLFLVIREVCQGLLESIAVSVEDVTKLLAIDHRVEMRFEVRLLFTWQCFELILEAVPILGHVVENLVRVVGSAGAFGLQDVLD